MPAARLLASLLQRRPALPTLRGMHYRWLPGRLPPFAAQVEGGLRVLVPTGGDARRSARRGT